MNAKKLSAVVLTLATLSVGLAPSAARADDGLVLGAVIGGIAGAVIGSSMGGGNSTLVGAAVGTMAGAAIGSSSGYQAQGHVAHPVAYAPPPPPPRVYRVAYVQPAYQPRVVHRDRHDWREHRAWRERHEAREHGFQYPPYGR